MDKREAEDILELQGCYSATDLRKAYFHALKQYHPDKHPAGSKEYDDATRLTQDVNVAKDLLQRLFDEGAETLVSEPVARTGHAASCVSCDASWIDRNPSAYNFGQALNSVLARRNY